MWFRIEKGEEDHPSCRVSYRDHLFANCGGSKTNLLVHTSALGALSPSRCSLGTYSTWPLRTFYYGVILRALIYLVYWRHGSSGVKAKALPIERLFAADIRQDRQCQDNRCMDFQEKLVYSQMHAGLKGRRLTAYTATAPRYFVCTAPERFEDHVKRTGPDPDGHSDQATYFIPHIVLNGF